MARSWLNACVIMFAVTAAAKGAETETQYLSGKGKDDPVKWDFMCSAGQNAGKWSTIGVPSNWELQGFGTYTYGTARLNPWPKVTGNYKRTFTVPDNWKGKQISIVFEGVMTDTQVKVNGESAGPLHAGGYYQFKYDITKLLKAGDNLLEVTVDDESATPSVNNAERRGDYWNYAGIFRPVHLDAVPEAHIEHVAIDARADGTLTVNVALSEFQTTRLPVVTAQLIDMQGQKVGTPFDVTHGQPVKIANPKLWTAETPNLYQLELTLDAGEGRTHTVKQKFGFRTIEVRPGAGLFLNGTRIMLKGADRHSFWPDSGRCLSPEISKQDIALMKDMNMNAVRMSHYPPDQHFLDACDEMGMYVLDELGGWHQAYDTTTGHRLVQEMVTRDVNHPSILFWDNGNEGGWNTALDNDFAQWDPQKRLVIHPQQTQAAKGLDNSHYPQYQQVVTKAAADNVFFPTEMLHGLYDGGHGAGLEDYWKVMQTGKATAGGFLWSLADETLVRTDKGGILDSNGNQAPDGIVGPYREKEGSFYTIKEIWSPVIVRPPTSSTRAFEVENRYSFTNTDQCQFKWETIAFHKPNEAESGAIVMATRTDKGKGLTPGASSQWDGWGPPSPTAEQVAQRRPDAMRLHISDPTGREIRTYVWPASQFGGPSAAQDLTKELVEKPGVKAGAAESDDAIRATAGDMALKFNKQSGLLTEAVRAGKNFSFVNGPRLVAQGPTPAAPARGGQAAAPTFAPDSKLTSLEQKSEGNDVVITAKYDGPLNTITYRLRASGWLTIDYAYTLNGPHEYFGVGFDYPEANVQSMRYLGNGPSTVWQNRLAGGTLDVWDKKYNNTMVGDPDDLKPGEKFDYPIFKGYYSGIQWLQLKTTEGPITALVNQSDLFVQVFSPKVPPANQIGQTGVPFPKAGISFLHAIPAIGSKFNGPKTSGPQGQPAIANGQYKGSISLYFGDLR